MNDAERILELSRYRLRQADEALSESRVLRDAEHYRGAINRAYYRASEGDSGKARGRNASKAYGSMSRISTDNAVQNLCLEGSMPCSRRSRF